MTGPTFLGIGAQKAGTTWLYRALELRPDVWLPPVKELHAFDEKLVNPVPWFEQLHGTGGAAMRWRRQLRNERRRRGLAAGDADEEARRQWTSRYFFETPSPDWYRDLFAVDRPVSGEITPDYAVLDDDRVDRAVRTCPDVQAVYLLRNPIEREWSATMMATRNATREPDAVLRANRRHVEYTDNIDRWSRALGPGRLYVGFNDDIASSPRELLTDVLDFIGAGTDSVQVPAGRPNSGNLNTMPARYAVALAHEFAHEIDSLAQRFGGVAQTWASSAAKLRRTEPTGTVPYPLEPIHASSDLSSRVI